MFSREIVVPRLPGQEAEDQERGHRRMLKLEYIIRATVIGC
jgi:hypothetical protein